MRATTARLGLTALLAGSGLAIASPAHAAECTDSEGVTVVVEHGGTSSTECAGGDPKDAGEALESAGFAVEKVQADPKLLCTIDDAPKTSCAEAPEAETFWAFYTASDGGSWEFADQGVFDFDPEPGSTIGFRFGDGAEPALAPDEAADEVAAENDSAQESPSADGDTDAAASDETEESGTSALVPTVIGVALLALLAGGGFFVARRRRH